MKDIKVKYGPWALITGASSGIGAEFAQQLAEIGLNLILVARRKNLLDVLAKKYSQKYNIDVKVISADLTSEDYYNQIIEATKDLDIGLLVNNAGGGEPGAFMKQPLEKRIKTIDLNIVAPLQLTYFFLEKISQRNKSGVIFVGSTGGFVSTPYLANYTATKAYLHRLGEALHYELKPKGVDVLVVAPGPTRTEFGSNSGMDLSKMRTNWMTATPVVKTALKGLGRKKFVIPGKINRIMIFFMIRIMPNGLSSKIFSGMIKKVMNPELL